MLGGKTVLQTDNGVSGDSRKRGRSGHGRRCWQYSASRSSSNHVGHDQSPWFRRGGRARVRSGLGLALGSAVATALTVLRTRITGDGVAVRRLWDGVGAGMKPLLGCSAAAIDVLRRSGSSTQFSGRRKARVETASTATAGTARAPRYTARRSCGRECARCRPEATQRTLAGTSKYPAPFARLIVYNRVIRCLRVVPSGLGR